MLELPILGLLKQEPMHGYQLSKELTDALGGFWRVSYGSLYPTLKRLQKQGAVETQEAAVGGRRKNVYRITDAGEAMFEELLSENTSQDSAGSEDTRFRMRLAFFRYLKPETRIRLLERRRASLVDQLESLETRLATASPSADAYTLSLMSHGQDSTRSDIDWLDGLIAAERVQLETGTDVGATKRSRTTRTTRTARSTTARSAKTKKTDKKKQRRTTRTTPVRRKEHTS